jgi:hypothetical protein
VRHPLERVVQVDRGLGPAEEEHAVRSKQLPRVGENLLLGGGVEIDEDVAEKDHVHRRQRRPARGEIHLLEVDHATEVAADDPFEAVAREVLHQHRRGEAAVDLDLPVLPGARLREHLFVQVRREDADVPVEQLREVLAEQHRDAVGLLARRRGGRPDGESALLGPAREQLRKQDVAERVEGMPIAEERRLVGGHRLDHLALQRAVTRALEPSDELAQRSEPGLARDRRQARLDEVSLPVLEHDRGLLVHELPDVVELGARERHDAAPTAAPGAVRPIAARRVISMPS